MHLSCLISFLIALQVAAFSASKNLKRGLAFAESDASGSTDIMMANSSGSAVSWQYNWRPTPPEYLKTSGIPYIPMQWGASGIQNFAAIVKAQGSKTVLGFNEPDLAEQSNIDPTYAAMLWKQYIDPLSSEGVRLGAPAVSSGPTGRPWLSAFLTACAGCTIDFLPFHWYGTGAADFNAYIAQMHAQFPDRPLWVTEFASTSMDDAEVYDFLVNTTAYMDSMNWIEGYSWFAFIRKQNGSSYNLLDANGGLSRLGANYIN